MADDILDRIADLHRQATVERSHYYTGETLLLARDEIVRLRAREVTLPELLGFEAGRAHAVAWLRAWAAKLEAAPACHEDVIQAAALSAAAGALERGEHA